MKTTRLKSEIDVVKYGAMCQQVQDIDERLTKFIENEFHYLSNRVDWMLYLLIGALVGVVTDLVLRLVK